MRFEEPPPQSNPRVAPVIAQRNEPAEPPPAIERPSVVPAVSLGRRNLFAYRQHERPAIAAAPRAIEPPPALPESRAAITEPSTPPPVPFPWRYIGTFGPAHDRLAAFKRDGDILTIRPGQRLGGFVLRRIGIESVEVEGPDGMRRVPLSAQE